MGFLSNMFDRFNGVTAEDRENCKALSEITGLQWRPFFEDGDHMIPDIRHYRADCDSWLEGKAIADALNELAYQGDAGFWVNMPPSVCVEANEFKYRKAQEFSAESLKREIQNRIGSMVAADRQKRDESLAAKLRR